MKYYATTAERQVELDIDSSQNKICLDGTEYESQLIPLAREGFFLLRIGEQTHEVFLTEDSRGIHVTYSNKKYTIHIEDEKSKFIQSLIKAEDKQTGEIEIIAPMPGLVTKILVKEGDSIKSGDSLLIVEAMKMENELHAASEGVIKKILTKERDSIEKDAVLMIVA